MKGLRCFQKNPQLDLLYNVFCFCFRQLTKIFPNELLAHLPSTSNQQHIEQPNCVDKIQQNCERTTIDLKTTKNKKK